MVRWYYLLLAFTIAIGFSESKKELTQGERVQQLTDAAIKKPIINLNSEKFRQFVKATPRNYSVVVMFTALAANRQCGICRHASDEFQLVGNSWRYSPSFSNKLFFAMLDFDEGSDIFQQLHLNSAPVFMHFPAKGKPKKLDTLEIQRVGFSSESIARWVAERTEIQIRVFRPPNYTGLLALVVLLAMVVGLLYLRKNNLDFLYNSTTWGLIALAFVFVMTSGQMWNHIRGPPFLQKTQGGNIAYIHGSSQGQFIVETYIIASLYAAVSLGLVLLTQGYNVLFPSHRRGSLTRPGAAHSGL
ncbi:tumor suppressor candidate 3 isoform X2 [Hyalella azteca]|uniref:Tumor suppressor candidate 3 isoform X2 n=1 Tax=Hyalella azteca TaxID=294128 RepID=A0A979FTE6_HYAAZ|nr:tumor suppressor candidate 3 isoform X2 [Hyalella azteca]